MQSLSVPTTSVLPTNGAPPPSNLPQPIGAEEKPDATSDFASLLAASWFSLTPTEVPAPAPPKTGAAEVAAGAVPALGGAAELAPTEQLLAAPESMSTEALLALKLQNQGAAEAGAAPINSAVSGETEPIADFAAAWSAQSQSLQTEAAHRDSMSVAAMLAENSRLARPAFSSSSLKPMFSAVSAANFADEESLNAPTPESVLATNAASAQAQLAATLRDDIVSGEAETARSVAGQIAGPALELFEKLSPREAGTLHLRLNPEELGRVDVQITRDAAGRLSAQLMAEHEAARRALSDGINHLRETLERAGVAVERLDVAVDVQTGANNFAGEQKQFQEAARALSSAASAASATVDTTLDLRPAAPAEDRLVSIRA